MRNIRHHIAAVLLLVSLSVTAILLAPLSTSASTPLPQAASPAAGIGVTHGIHLRPVAITGADGIYHGYGQEIEAFDNLVGKNVGVVMYFTDWAKFDPFLSDAISAYLPASRRPVIILSWEPGSSSVGCDLGYRDNLGPVRSIAQGRCDNYIRGFAQTLKARPERYLLRLAHEMNITDSPWGAGRYGSTPGDYVAMWRRVHDIFASVGVPNVEWVWSPNYASNPVETWNTIQAYYPGDGYVDWIGLSGYNWYTSRGQPWGRFATLYDAVLKDLTCRYAKPQILAELGIRGRGYPTNFEGFLGQRCVQADPHISVRAWCHMVQRLCLRQSHTSRFPCHNGNGRLRQRWRLQRRSATPRCRRRHHASLHSGCRRSELHQHTAHAGRSYTRFDPMWHRSDIYCGAPGTVDGIGRRCGCESVCRPVHTPVTISVQAPSTFKTTLSSQLLSPPLGLCCVAIDSLDRHAAEDAYCNRAGWKREVQREGKRGFCDPSKVSASCAGLSHARCIVGCEGFPRLPPGAGEVFQPVWRVRRAH